MTKVRRFFKRTESKPFTYASIEERRTRHNYFVWIIGTALLIMIGVVVLLVF